MIGSLESCCGDPYRNLAVEERLLDLCEDGPILYLWQNERTVVIGRNQEARRECRVELLRAEGGHLARRLSGGGAVYHDLGNLNFSFLARRGDYDVSRQLAVVCRALESFGLRPEISGRNDLVLDGRKFSGSAFYQRGERFCHHGTIMVDVDGAAMTRYLAAPGSKMAAKGVASVQSRVASLRELLPGITVETVKAALLAAFEQGYREKCAPLELSALKGEKLTALENRFRDPDWIFGRERSLPVEHARRFAWGEVSARLCTAGERIADVLVYSDAMEPEWVSALQSRLTGAEYSRRGLLAALESCPAPEPVKRDLAEWINQWEVAGDGTEI